MSNVHLVVAKHVLMNDDIHGQCASGEWWPRIVIIRKSGCNFKIEQQQRVVEQGSNTFYYTDFVVKNVTATCKYMCAIKHLRDMKTVVVTGTYACNCVCSYIRMYLCMYNVYL